MSFYNVINPSSMQAGASEDIGPILSNFQAIASVLNGAIDNSNISPTAAIDITKINIPSDIGHGIVPIGGTIDYAGAGDPVGGFFLLADGRALSRTAYSALYTAIGTTYGVGDGSTTFNLPDLRGRSSIGPDNMGTGAGAANRVATNNARGNVGGEEKHTLTVGEMPTHSHTGSTGNDTPDHSHSGSTSTDGSHQHGVSANITASKWGSAAGNVVSLIGGAGLNTGWSMDAAGSHNHTVSTGGASARHQHPISPEGGGAAANNMSPYQVLNKLIRVL
jgi:microcystin-dependent protein